MSNEYFVVRGARFEGPYSGGELKQLARGGQITRDDLIRKRDGKPTRAANVKGLFADASVREEPIQPETSEPETTGNGLIVKTWDVAAKATAATSRLVSSVTESLKNKNTAIKPQEPTREISQGWAGPVEQDTYVSPGMDQLIQESLQPVVPARVQRGGLATGDDLTDCPFCGESIKRVAKKCKHCGEILDVVMRAQAGSSATLAQPQINIHNINTVMGGRGKRWSPMVALLLSLLIPGLGQLYKGQVLNGIAWFCFVVFGYVFIIPGLILHLCCIAGAASGDPYA